MREFREARRSLDAILERMLLAYAQEMWPASPLVAECMDECAAFFASLSQDQWDQTFLRLVLAALEKMHWRRLEPGKAAFNARRSALLVQVAKFSHLNGSILQYDPVSLLAPGGFWDILFTCSSSFEVTEDFFRWLVPTPELLLQEDYFGVFPLQFLSRSYTVATAFFSILDWRLIGAMNDSSDRRGNSPLADSVVSTGFFGSSIHGTPIDFEPDASTRAEILQEFKTRANRLSNLQVFALWAGRMESSGLSLVQLDRDGRIFRLVKDFVVGDLLALEIDEGAAGEV